MKKIFITTALLLSLTACSDEFINLAPVSERNVEEFYKTPADFNNAVLGAYSALRLGGIYGDALIYTGEVAADNTDLGSTRSSINIYNFEFVDKVYTGANGFFNTIWQDHYRAIARANNILGAIDEVAMADNLKKQYTGEAQFLRALLYFNLVRIYGDVTLITRPVTSLVQASGLARNPAAEVYKLIEEDLLSAEEKLPLTYAAADLGRATKGAAQGLLGKVYLTLKQYDKAAPKLKAVLDGNRYRLLPSYTSVFDFNNPNNAEILFDVQYRSGNLGLGSNLWEKFAPFNASVAVLGANGGSGAGVNRPLADLVKAYEPNDTRKAASIATAYKNAQGKDVNENFVIKFRQQGAVPGDGDGDWPVLRYADVLLMYAEVLNEQGKPTEAAPFLNQVRKRAGLTDTKAGSQADLRLAIEAERRVELAFESHRWFDLVRTGRFVEVMTAKGFKVQAFNTVFPVPQREIDLNKALAQNQGY